MNTYLQCFQHRHIVQQRFVHLALAERRLEQNAPERLSVHRPQLADRLSLHSCRTTNTNSLRPEPWISMP